MNMKQTIITILLALVAMTGQAQITLKGSIVNERGEKVEYVSVGPAIQVKGYEIEK